MSSPIITFREALYHTPNKLLDDLEHIRAALFQAQPAGQVPLFVALDCERSSLPVNDSLSEVGLAVLDPLQYRVESYSDQEFYRVVNNYMRFKYLHVHESYHKGDSPKRPVIPTNFGAEPESLQLSSVYMRVLTFLHNLSSPHTAPATRRPMVLVGWDLENDFDLLQQSIGYPILNSLFVNFVDAQALLHQLRGGLPKVALTEGLAWVKIKYFNLHNALNDAAYTLRLLVCVTMFLEYYKEKGDFEYNVDAPFSDMGEEEDEEE